MQDCICTVVKQNSDIHFFSGHGSRSSFPIVKKKNLKWIFLNHEPNPTNSEMFETDSITSFVMLHGIRCGHFAVLHESVTSKDLLLHYCDTKEYWYQTKTVSYFYLLWLPPNVYQHKDCLTAPWSVEWLLNPISTPRPISMPEPSLCIWHMGTWKYAVRVALEFHADLGSFFSFLDSR